MPKLHTIANCYRCVLSLLSITAGTDPGIFSAERLLPSSERVVAYHIHESVKINRA